MTDEYKFGESKYQRMNLEELLAIATPEQLVSAKQIVAEPLFPVESSSDDLKLALEAVFECDDPDNEVDMDEDWDAQVQVQVPTISKKK